MARAVVALVCLLLLPQILVGQGADTTKGRGAEAEVQVRFDSTLAGLRTPAALAAPWLGAPRVPPGLRAAAWDSAVAAARDSARRDLSRGQRLLLLYGEPVVPSVAAAEEPTAAKRGVLGLGKEYADLGIDGEVRLEIRSDRVRNERCSAILFLDPNSGCRGGFKPPRLENHINLRSTGLLGPSGPPQRGLRQRPRLQCQQRHPGLLRGPGGRDRPPRRDRHRHVSACTLAIHHGRHPGQQLRRQRAVRGRQGPDPGAGRDPEGQPGRRADVHGRPDHQPGAGPPAPGPRLRERPVLLGGGPDDAARLPGAGHPRSVPGHAVPVRAPRPGAGLSLPARPEPDRRQLQPHRHHRDRPHDRSHAAVRAGAVGAAGPGDRLLPRPVRAVVQSGHQAGPG